MYNRYLSGSEDSYSPVRENHGLHGPADRDESTAPPPFRPQQQPPSPVDRIQQLLGISGKRENSEGTPLRRLLARFHLEDVDTGDLLLLILLFFLLEEKADDELLIALGILLIL